MNGESAQVAGGSDGMGLLLLGKTALSLLVVVGIILLCAWLLKRLGPNRRAGGQHLRVVASTPVGQRERVVIVEVEDRWLVLGVGSGQVSKLDTLTPPPEPSHTTEKTDTPLSGSFATRLGQALRHNASQSLKRRPDSGADS
ncbi:flagellar biosynthetic protein FliO [Salinicola avicenniae]|uniref:flagellar biosynthetic protein FliO n=1 Tax=Salinicola avicenniae TaxID=2916836 RepID=UPI002073CA30|nr:MULTISPECIES: flagellar biosynthetic protein FliO [unclassified Salinicola]